MLHFFSRIFKSLRILPASIRSAWRATLGRTSRNMIYVATGLVSIAFPVLNATYTYHVDKKTEEKADSAAEQVRHLEERIANALEDSAKSSKGMESAQDKLSAAQIEIKTLTENANVLRSELNDQAERSAVAQERLAELNEQVKEFHGKYLEAMEKSVAIQELLQIGQQKIIGFADIDTDPLRIGVMSNAANDLLAVFLHRASVSPSILSERMEEYRHIETDIVRQNRIPLEAAQQLVAIALDLDGDLKSHVATMPAGYLVSWKSNVALGMMRSEEGFQTPDIFPALIPAMRDNRYAFAHELLSDALVYNANEEVANASIMDLLINPLDDNGASIAEAVAIVVQHLLSQSAGRIESQSEVEANAKEAIETFVNYNKSRIKRYSH